MRGLPKFTPAEGAAAYEAWGCNCGPTALAAMCEITLEEARDVLFGFEGKRYTNPTMMMRALQELKRPYHWCPYNPARDVGQFPEYGLARIQWCGPWTAPGANPKWAYRQTHWVGAQHGNGSKAGQIGIYDCNSMSEGNPSGWSSLEDWEAIIVPAIVRSIPRADGRWYITHAVELPRETP